MLVIPEILLIPMSIALLIGFCILWVRKLKEPKALASNDNNRRSSRRFTFESGNTGPTRAKITSWKRILVMLLILLAAIWHPSALAAPYLLLFYLILILFMLNVRIYSTFIYAYVCVTVSPQRSSCCFKCMVFDCHLHVCSAYCNWLITP